MKNYQFTKNLQEKINLLKEKRTPIKLGSVPFSSKLIMAPLASITDLPYRVVMSELGAGGAVSELVSCHGINYGNDKTLNMLKIDKSEGTVGLQIFGEDEYAMAKAAKKCEEFNPSFIDINVGCPVKKVITKGAGSALLKDLNQLEKIIIEVKKIISVPLSLKIRSGWSKNNYVANDIIDLAHKQGVEFISLHGRTREQLYTGIADWNYIERVAEKSKIPIIGNGDLHNYKFIKEKLANSNCQAFMLGRGPLRFPFIFLEAYMDNEIIFSPNDYFEVIKKYYSYICNYYDRDRIVEIQLKKHAVWIISGFPGASSFRKKIFTLKGHIPTMEFIEEYFLQMNNETQKKINLETPFLSGGHG